MRTFVVLRPSKTGRHEAPFVYARDLGHWVRLFLFRIVLDWVAQPFKGCNGSLIDWGFSP